MILNCEFLSENLKKIYDHKLNIKKPIKELRYSKELKILKSIKSKKHLYNLLKECDISFINCFKKYIKNYYIIDIKKRKIKNPIQYISKRKWFFKIMENPKILENNLGFDKNIVKNFSFGFAMFYERNNYLFNIEFYKE